jgi:hypothetical protein
LLGKANIFEGVILGEGGGGDVGCGGLVLERIAGAGGMDAAGVPVGRCMVCVLCRICKHDLSLLRECVSGVKEKIICGLVKINIA